MENNLIKMLGTGKLSDVKLIVGQGPRTLEFNSHKVILCGLSGYFNTALSPESQFKEARENVVTLPETDPRVFKEILTYLYTNRWKSPQNPEDFAPEYAAAVYAQAAYFDIPSVKACVIKDLVDRIRFKYWSHEYFVTLKSVFEHYVQEDEKLIKPLIKEIKSKGDINCLMGLENGVLENILRGNAHLAVAFVKHLVSKT